MARIKIKVEKMPVRNIIKDLQTGTYLLPSFQRNYVWDEEDVRDLIDSIVNQYPIGTIILWKPSNEHEQDPFSKPFFDKGTGTSSRITYVIDGQQRLTSLLLLFEGWTISREGKQIGCKLPISYHPTSKKFWKSKKIGVDLTTIIKAYALLDTSAQEELKEITPKTQQLNMQEVAQQIIDYEIPVYVMITDQEDEGTYLDMTEAFIRVNRYGIRIGNIELMLSFLAGSIKGDLKNKINDLYEDLFTEFEIDLQPIIRFVFSTFGLKQTQITKVDGFKRNVGKINAIDEAERKTIFSNCERTLKLTVGLLKNTLGITSSKLLPSQMPLVTIASYLYEKNINKLDELEPSDIKNIIDWFILVNFNGYYTATTDTKLQEDLEIIKSSKNFPFTDIIKNMEERGAKTTIGFEDIQRGLNMNAIRSAGRAHLFILYVLLTAKKAGDWNKKYISQNKYEDLARHHIFPSDFLRENLDIDDRDEKEMKINNLANLTFIHTSVNSSIGNDPPERYMTDYIASASEHFIPKDENSWKFGQYESFLTFRIREIYDAAKATFGEIFT